MNRSREERGVDRIAGELRAAVPDVAEFLDRIEAIEESASQHLAEWAQARKTENVAYLALRADLEMLEEEIRRGRNEWKTRADEIDRGVEDLSVLYPTLGFTIIKPLPPDVPA